MLRKLPAVLAGIALVFATGSVWADTPVDVLYTFPDRAGDHPSGPLTLVGSNLYGATQGLGPDVFEYPIGGSGVTVLSSLGAGDIGITGLTAVGQTLYGVTNQPSVYSIGTDGSNYTDVQNFPSNGSGSLINAPLTLVGTTLYGMTTNGGANGSGTIFSLGTSPSSFNVLTSFPQNTNSGDVGSYGPMVASGNTLYGGTGSTSDAGTVFGVQTDGTGYTTLHTFAADSIVQALTLVGSSLYGVLEGGVGGGNGEIFSMGLDGSNFTVLHTFSGSDGDPTAATLTLVGSTLWGTTTTGGANEEGTIFSFNTTSDAYTLYHSFTGTDGFAPEGLTLVGSTLYGVTFSGGGTGQDGVIFSIPTPEPASIGLLLAGLPVLWFGRRTIARRTRRCRS